MVHQGSAPSFGLKIIIYDQGQILHAQLPNACGPERRRLTFPEPDIYIGGCYLLLQICTGLWNVFPSL